MTVSSRSDPAHLAHYRSACALATTEPEAALDRLEQALEAGFAGAWLLEHDERLAPLRTSERFRAAVAPLVSPAAFYREYALLDFWIGDWVVRSAEGEHLGDDAVRRLLGGAAIEERWIGASGDVGIRLFYCDVADRTWRQVWVTGYANAKEKRLVEATADGGVAFQGRVRLRRGGEMLDRTTLVPLADGTVRQVIATSSDEGATWSTGFDAIYVRRSDDALR